jgi:site-specific recombinase XerD
MYYEIPHCPGPFSEMIAEFVSQKRALGHDYGKPMVYRLREIGIFLMNAGAARVSVTEAMFDLWAAKRDNEAEYNRMRRINTLIAFSKFLVSKGFDDIYVGEAPYAYPRRQFVPYIFTRREISALFTAFRERVTSNPGDITIAATAVMFCLYYGCGLRKTEAQELRVRDFDAGSGVLRIMDSKNHVSRMVVASSTATRQLAEYFRAFCLCREKEDRLFRNGRGNGIPDQTLYAHYHAALGSAGIGCRESGRLPRIHDLRNPHLNKIRTFLQDCVIPTYS